MMKILLRLFCIAILIFTATMCFAGKEEEAAELAELKSQILEPITKNFSDSDAYLRLDSLELIELQKSVEKSRAWHS